MNTPLLSVCLITYNHKEFIEEAVNSILKQKHDFGWELIIADDCSTDGTKEIIRKYKEHYPDLIKLILQEHNIGSTPNWLQLMKSAKSKYVAYLDGDDYWTDECKIQKQVEFLEQHEEYSMCFTDSAVIDNKGNIKKPHRIDNKNRKDATQLDVLGGFVPPMNAVLYRNEYLQNILADFPNILNGDYYVSAIMSNFGKIGYLDSVTAAYRIHSNSMWSNLDEESRLINYTKTLMSLRGKVQNLSTETLERLINSNLSMLKELNEKEEFLVDNYWTPQTAMLRAIRDTVLQIEGTPGTALSIDKNPTLEKILLRKWPCLEIQNASYPEYDAQSLHQFKDETFDVVFSHQVIEHIPKPWIAAAEMNRVLKKGGIGIHTTCAYNPRHGYPAFKDYYRFLPDGLAELFDGVNIWVKDGWGSRQALIYNLTIDDGNGQLGGRRFVEALAKHNDVDYPWHTWVIFQKT